jgi:hypothetical protein
MTETLARWICPDCGTILDRPRLIEEPPFCLTDNREFVWLQDVEYEPPSETATDQQPATG